jgi:hypothetical protein
VTGLGMAGSAGAQQLICPSYFAAGLKKRWGFSKTYSLAMLAKMPDQYLSARPVPEVWTFPQQLTHLVDGNVLISAPLRGEKPVYVGDPRQLDRAALEKHLKESYDPVATALDRLKSDADAEEMVQFFDDSNRQAGFMLPPAGSCGASSLAGVGVFTIEGNRAAGI